MKFNLKALIFLLGSIIILTGCPYETEYSLSEHLDSKIDLSLTGKWKGVETSNTKDTASLNLKRFNENEYLLEFFFNPDFDYEKSAQLRCFESKIGDKRIMNLTEVGRKPKYTYVLIEHISDSLIVKYISDKFVKQKFNNKKEFRDYITENIDEEEMFESNFIFKKVN